MREVNDLADELDAYQREANELLRRVLGPEVAHEVECGYSKRSEKLLTGLPHDLSKDDLVALWRIQEEKERRRLVPVECPSGPTFEPSDCSSWSRELRSTARNARGERQSPL